MRRPDGAQQFQAEVRVVDVRLRDAVGESPPAVEPLTVGDVAGEA
ncbi:hypothetical protein ACFV7Q_23775 [Streptomyces sp. NPDC059851]